MISLCGALIALFFGMFPGGKLAALALLLPSLVLAVPSKPPNSGTKVTIRLVWPSGKITDDPEFQFQLRRAPFPWKTATRRMVAATIPATSLLFATIPPAGRSVLDRVFMGFAGAAIAFPMSQLGMMIWSWNWRYTPRALPFEAYRRLSVALPHLSGEDSVTLIVTRPHALSAGRLVGMEIMRGGSQDPAMEESRPLAMSLPSVAPHVAKEGEIDGLTSDIPAERAVARTELLEKLGTLGNGSRAALVEAIKASRPMASRGVFAHYSEQQSRQEEVESLSPAARERMHATAMDLLQKSFDFPSQTEALKTVLFTRKHIPLDRSQRQAVANQLVESIDDIVSRWGGVLSTRYYLQPEDMDDPRLFLRLVDHINALTEDRQAFAYEQLGIDPAKLGDRWMLNRTLGTLSDFLTKASEESPDHPFKAQAVQLLRKYTIKGPDDRRQFVQLLTQEGIPRDVKEALWPQVVDSYPRRSILQSTVDCGKTVAFLMLPRSTKQGLAAIGVAAVMSAVTAPFVPGMIAQAEKVIEKRRENALLKEFMGAYATTGSPTTHTDFLDHYIRVHGLTPELGGAIFLLLEHANSVSKQGLMKRWQKRVTEMGAPDALKDQSSFAAFVADPTASEEQRLARQVFLREAFSQGLEADLKGRPRGEPPSYGELAEEYLGYIP